MSAVIPKKELRIYAARLESLKGQRELLLAKISTAYEQIEDINLKITALERILGAEGQ